MLALHLRNRPREMIVTFGDEEPAHPHHNVIKVKFTDTVATIGRKFAEKVPPNSVVVYHNAYLLSILGGFDCAEARIIYWHSWDIPRGHLWRTKNIVTSDFFVSSSLTRLIFRKRPPSCHFCTLPLPARIGAHSPHAAEWKPRTEFSTSFGFIGRLEKRCKRADRIPVLAKLMSDSLGNSRIEIFGNGSLSGKLAGIYRNCQVIEKGWLERAELENHLLNLRATIVLSDHEGFGLMAVDSLALGLPVIFPRIDSDVVSILDSIDSRLLYPTGDLSKLTESMRWLADASPQELDHLSRRARHAVASRNNCSYFKAWDEAIAASLKRATHHDSGGVPSVFGIPNILPVSLFKAFSYYFT